MKRSNTEIEDILSSIDDISRASARPFMHTRIMARIKEESTFMSRAVGFFARPVVAFACLSAVLVANVYTVFNSDYEQQEQEPSPVASASTFSDVLQNENYILAVSDVNQYVNQ